MSQRSYVGWKCNEKVVCGIIKQRQQKIVGSTAVNYSDITLHGRGWRMGTFQLDISGWWVSCVWKIKSI